MAEPVRGPGRPRLPEGAARADRLTIRLTYAERALVDSAALKAKLAPSEWVRQLVRRAVKTSK